MIEREATWGDLYVDAYLRDKTGTVWRICAKDDRDAEPEMSPYYRCKNRAGEWLTISPKPLDTPVTILENVDGDQHLIGLVKDRLGATVVATQDVETKVVWCDSWDRLRTINVELREFRSHLDLMHGMYATDIKTYKQLVEAHDAAHDESQPHVGHGGVPHEHR